jgi:hypothetical protein
LVLRGILREQYYVDSLGRKSVASNVKVSGLDWVRIREIGVVVSILSAILSGLNVPVLLFFDLRQEGNRH